MKKLRADEFWGIIHTNQVGTLSLPLLSENVEIKIKKTIIARSCFV
jgi:hypothetical protein